MPQRMNPATWIIDIVSESKQKEDEEEEGGAAFAVAGGRAVARVAPPRAAGVDFVDHFKTSPVGADAVQTVADVVTLVRGRVV